MCVSSKTWACKLINPNDSSPAISCVKTKVISPSVLPRNARPHTASEPRTLPLMARTHIAPTSRLSVDDWIQAGYAILAEEGIKTLEEFAHCADWELAGGFTTVDGKRVKDEGLLEKFDMSLEEAQTLVMNARVQLGWVDPADLVPPEAEGTDEGAEAEAETSAEDRA